VLRDLAGRQRRHVDEPAHRRAACSPYVNYYSLSDFQSFRIRMLDAGAIEVVLLLFHAARNSRNRVGQFGDCLSMSGTLQKETATPIPSRLIDYLERRGTQFEIREHKHSGSSAETARTANIPPNQLAKSVIVEDDAGCLMAVLPSDRTVLLGELAGLLGRGNLRLSDEDRIATLFADCDRGAAPPVGMAWDIETIVDDELEACDVVYAEAGDHEHLLCMSHQQFHDLMRASRHGHFCRPAPH